MDAAHLMAALRYVALNSVRAGMVAKAEDWPWSSMVAHLDRVDDGMTEAAPVATRVPNFPTFWANPKMIRISVPFAVPRGMADRWDHLGL